MANLTKTEKELLAQLKAIASLVGSQAYQQGLKPWLEDRRSKSYPDPQQFKNEKEFTYAATVASVQKKVIAEILKYIEDEAPTEVKRLSEKKTGKQPNFEIGK